MLTKGQMLDRMELLYPEHTIFSDLRRAYIDRDPSSIIRLWEEGLDAEDARKFILGDDIWSLYRMILNINDSQIIKTIKSLHANETRWDSDALSQGQIKSKMWLIDELKHLDLDLGTVFLCAGWYGLLATLMFEHELKVEKVRSFDIDPLVKMIAEKFNLPWVKDEWKFKSVEADIHDLRYIHFNYTVVRADGTEAVLQDSADTVINTSCEHIKDFDEWYAKIPDGKLVILQSNNFKEVEEHVNIHDTLYSFAVQTPMEILFSNELHLGDYTRYMRIGYK